MVLGSFYDAVTREIRDSAPEILTVFGTQEGLELYHRGGLRGQLRPAHRALRRTREYAGLAMTAGACRQGPPVGVNIHAWTANEPDEMVRVLDMGVDGIITDDPVTLGAILAER